MRTLTRYVLLEFFKVFSVTLSSLTLLMIIVLLAKEGMDQGLGLQQVVRLLPFILPNALLYTVPGTTLFAACVVYGRMSGLNEVVAVKSLGINPLVLLWPCIYIGIFLSLFTLWLNDVAWSWGYYGVQRVVVEAGEEIAYGMLRTQRSYSTKQFSINVKQVDGRRLIHPTITFYNGERGAMTITADEAELRSDLANETLTMACFNSIVDVDGNAMRVPGWIEREISLKEVRQRGESNSPTHLTLGQLWEVRDKYERDLADLKTEYASKAALQMFTGDFEGLASKAWVAHGWELRDTQNYLYRVRSEPYRRCANGFSCLCFILVGAPVAIRLRNSDFLTSFFLCFLPILAVYYPLLMFGIDQTKSGIFPPYFVWLGNGILAAIGIWQLRKVVRY